MPWASSQEEDDSRKILEAVLRAKQMPFDSLLYVNAYVPSSTLQACRHILERQGTDTLVANLTAGSYELETFVYAEN